MLDPAGVFFFIINGNVMFQLSINCNWFERTPFNDNYNIDNDNGNNDDNRNIANKKKKWKK